MKKNIHQEHTAIDRKTIERLPKVELHRHLEGSFRLETLMDFARKKNLSDLPLDDKDAFRRIVQMTGDDQPDFLTFLSKFRADWYSTLADPRQLAYEGVEDASKENIVYYEMRFSPEHFRRTSDFAIEAVIEAVLEGASEASSKFGVETNFLITLGRDKLDVPQMKEYIKVCSKYFGSGVVGLDLAGDEIHYPPEDFKRVFKGLYDEYGVHATIHAGEAGSAENVRVAIEDLDAVRIGHGVHAIDDPAVVDLLIEKNVLLEQCLTSNIQTATIAAIQEHPFSDFYRQGVVVTLNSDDPQIQQSDLNDDYQLAAKHFGFSAEDFRKINLYALEGAFVSDDRKKALKASFQKKFDAALS